MCGGNTRGKAEFLPSSLRQPRTMTTSTLTRVTRRTKTYWVLSFTTRLEQNRKGPRNLCNHLIQSYAQMFALPYQMITNTCIYFAKHLGDNIISLVFFQQCVNNLSDSQLSIVHCQNTVVWVNFLTYRMLVGNDNSYLHVSIYYKQRHMALQIFPSIVRYCTIIVQEVILL